MSEPRTRPRSILMFERLYGLSIVVVLVENVLSWPVMAAALARIGMGPGLMLVGQALGLAIPLLLWWFTARRGSPVARGLAVALTALVLLGFVFSVARGRVGVVSVVDAARLALQIAALAFTFRPDARAWFWPDAQQEPS